jgi:DNA-binding CsgD family transcriptional regulator
MIEPTFAQEISTLSVQGYVDRVLGVLSDLDRESALTVLRRAAATYCATFDVLSLRERQVFELLIQGMTNRDAGDRLGISAKTVDTHRTHIMKKIGVHSACELVRFAAHAGYLP